MSDLQAPSTADSKQSHNLIALLLLRPPSIEITFPRLVSHLLHHLLPIGYRQSSKSAPTS